VEGTGLGLALSKQLVELMGGEIGVVTRQGEGSTFWVDLACAQQPQADGAEPVPTTEHPEDLPSSTRQRTILLIEDNLANLKLVQRLMAKRSHLELLPAVTGSLGLELAREHHPDLILLDQHLPDVRGAEVLQRLKADPETRTVPVVVVSADATAGQVRRLLELGAVEYLTKPLDVAKFLRVLDLLLEMEQISS